jgi:hypothetical protein
MFNSVAKSPAKGVVMAFILVAMSIPFQKGIDGFRGEFKPIEEAVYFSSSALKKMSLGYGEILADVYWLRAIQYFGDSERKQKEKNPDILYKYFDILTDLDPKFVNAYRFGGTFLAEPPPFGLGELEKGVELFDKGRKNNPGNFRLPLEEAFLFYLYEKDYERAAELFREASEKPGLSPFRRMSLKGMAASAHSKGGNRELSKRIWQIIYETSPSEGRRGFALRNLEELNTVDMEDRLTEGLREYVRRYNTLPAGIEALKDVGIIKQIPKEPLGGDFIIAGKLMVVRSSTLVDQELKLNLGFLTSRAHKFKNSFGRYPNDLAELKEFIEYSSQREFPSHPLGEEYAYNPETGVVQTR